MRPLWKRRPGLFIFRLLALGGVFSWGCSIFATRPVQEMSYTLAAIKAAKEVQADTYTPELFRLSNEWFFRAKNEYKFKNFKLAREYADKARHLAEQAEFEAIRSGAIRSEGADAPGGSPESASLPPGGGGPRPASTPTPTGTPVEVFEQRKAEEDAKNAPPPPAPATGLPRP
jgi:hypothetical protein